MILIYENNPLFACLYMKSFAFIRESFAFIREVSRLIRESFAFIRESLCLFAKNIIFFPYVIELNWLSYDCILIQSYTEMATLNFKQKKLESLKWRIQLFSLEAHKKIEEIIRTTKPLSFL